MGGVQSPGVAGSTPPLDFSCLAMKGGGVEVVPRLPPPKPLLSTQAWKGVCSKSRSKKIGLKKIELPKQLRWSSLIGGDKNRHADGAFFGAVTSLPRLLCYFFNLSMPYRVYIRAAPSEKYLSKININSHHRVFIIIYISGFSGLHESIS